ncbi:MAG: XRE family transcriptional regulator [Woeseia sp.]
MAVCLTAGIAAVAQNRGTQLNSVKAGLEAPMDSRGIPGMDSCFRKNGLTQMRAAKFFGITQPKVSYIMNGMVDKVSSDYLVGLLAKTGGEFRYSFKQPTRRQVMERLSA